MFGSRAGTGRRPSSTACVLSEHRMCTWPSRPSSRQQRSSAGLFASAGGESGLCCALAGTELMMTLTPKRITSRPRFISVPFRPAHRRTQSKPVQSVRPLVVPVKDDSLGWGSVHTSADQAPGMSATPVCRRNPKPANYRSYPDSGRANTSSECFVSILSEQELLHGAHCPMREPAPSLSALIRTNRTVR